MAPVLKGNGLELCRDMIQHQREKEIIRSICPPHAAYPELDARSGAVPPPHDTTINNRTSQEIFTQFASQYASHFVVNIATPYCLLHRPRPCFGPFAA